LEDEALILSLKKSDEKAFEQLFRKYFYPLSKYAGFYTGTSCQAEDIVQDVFYSIWETREKMLIHTSIKAYLYKSVHNRCIQYLRHQTVVQKHNGILKGKYEESMIMNRLFYENGLTKLFEKEIGSLLKEALGNLPEKTRSIFLFSRQQHYKNSEIAKKYEISEKSVEYHISKALHLLRQDLKDYLTIVLIIVMI
jgi:RNA polymerase sigma-70 factor, ECF subfamily